MPIARANSNQIGKELAELNKKCKAKLDRQAERLQLLIVILPDFKGRFYGKFSIKSKIKF